MKKISYPYIGKVNTEIPLPHIVTYKSNVITIEIFFWEIEKQPKNVHHTTKTPKQFQVKITKWEKSQVLISDNHTIVTHHNRLLILKQKF